MSILDRYPLHKTDHVKPLRAALERVPGLSPRLSEDYAIAMNGIADKARDLEDIFSRLLGSPEDPAELAALLAAFEMTLEQIRGDSDVLNGKLYALADRLTAKVITGHK
jgi:hypothetical protein